MFTSKCSIDFIPDITQNVFVFPSIPQISQKYIFLAGTMIEKLMRVLVTSYKLKISKLC